MKKKEKSLINQKSENELAALISQVSGEIMKLSVSRYTELKKNTRTGRQLRRKLAIAKTALRMRKLGGGA